MNCILPAIEDYLAHVAFFENIQLCWTEDVSFDSTYHFNLAHRQMTPNIKLRTVHYVVQHF
jgi:hypothetical protein